MSSGIHFTSFSDALLISHPISQQRHLSSSGTGVDAHRQTGSNNDNQSSLSRSGTGVNTHGQAGSKNDENVSNVSRIRCGPCTPLHIL